MIWLDCFIADKVKRKTILTQKLKLSLHIGVEHQLKFLEILFIHH